MDIKRILALSGVSMAGMVSGYLLLNPPKAPAQPAQVVQIQAAPVEAPAKPAPVEVQYQYVDAPAQSSVRSERGEREKHERKEEAHEYQDHDD